MKIIYLIDTVVVVIVVLNFVLDSKVPLKTIKAKLVDKKDNTYIDNNNIVMEEYNLYFEISEGIKEFSVKHSIYKKYSKGMEGNLTYKRHRFVDFG